ncbi:MAG TPA: PASTA domain-containing protein [Candidatus Polarisedimenticolia bacterium]|nr:PASTA domain-containing protein [Candidatus Polarisedimenticolia bacterium]
MNLPGKERLRRHALLAAKILAFCGTLAIVAALSAYFTVRRSISGRDIQVPDLSQLTVDEAAALLKKSGLVLEEAAQRNDERVEAGRILAQDPPPGADIKQQRKVKVVVSLGDKVSSIPELRGGAARRAQITLQQQGMRLGNQIYVYARSEAENMVIGQDPLPEGAGLREAKIALLVSRGLPPRTYVMPDLTGRPQAQVVAFLARAGLKPGAVHHDSTRPAPRGTVVGQSPPSGFPVRSGDLVTLTVAGGGEDDG